MENKNKNDMSVDELVKQLKLVLDIDEDDTAPLPTEEKAAEPEPRETAEPAEDAAEKKPAYVSGSMSEKVRMLDEFFDAEEEKKTRKKDRKKRRDKKKNRQKPLPLTQTAKKFTNHGERRTENE